MTTKEIAFYYKTFLTEKKADLLLISVWNLGVLLILGSKSSSNGSMKKKSSHLP